MAFRFFQMFSHDIAVDLGTSSTLIYARGRGVVCHEPSVVAVQPDGTRGGRKVIAVGNEAKQMLGRTPGSIEAVRPLRDGVITDFAIAEEMLRHFIKKARVTKSFIRPRMIVCVPHGVTEVERRAVRESAELAGAREVFLIEEPMAAAIGAGLPIAEAAGNMILDIGGGTSEVAIISLKGIVFSQTLRVAGDRMDEAVINYVRRRYNALIGDRTAEEVKIAIGSALPTGEDRSIEVRGRDLIHGTPRALTLHEDEIRESISEALHQLVELIRSTLERTPPELAADVLDRGLALTGGGALLTNLDRFLAQNLGLPVTLVDDPISAVVLGSGAVLDQLDQLRDVVIQ